MDLSNMGNDVNELIGLPAIDRHVVVPFYNPGNR